MNENVKLAQKLCKELGIPYKLGTGCPKYKGRPLKELDILSLLQAKPQYDDESVFEFSMTGTHFNKCDNAKRNFKVSKDSMIAA